MQHTLAYVLACVLVFSSTAGAGAASDMRMVGAARSRDRAAVRALLREGVSVNAAAPDGATPLHWASHLDDVPLADLLIRAGADVNAANALGVTPLILACTSGSAGMVERLLAAGAKPNIVMPTGESPLMLCARTATPAAIRLLVAKGADVNAAEHLRGQTALMWAVQAPRPEIVRVLVESGADVNARTRTERELAYTGYRYITSPPPPDSGTVRHVDVGGYTPLLFAAQQGDVEAARILVDAGAPVDAAAQGGETPLILAAFSGHEAVGTFLLSKGADPNVAAPGYTALHAAVLRGNSTLVDALLAAGANPNARLRTGTPVRKYSKDYALSTAWAGATPLWLASKFAETTIIRALTTHGADPFLAANDGTLPLHAAIPAKSGGDRRDRYISPVEAAALDPAADERAAVEAVRTLLDARADIDAVNTNGDTPLHAAVSRGYSSVVDVLIQKGAALNVKNRADKTPLDIAARSPRGPENPFAPPGEAQETEARLTTIAGLLRKAGAQE